MKEYQKKEIIRSIKDIEERIDNYTNTVKQCAENVIEWCGTEQLSVYSARLNGYVQELRGMCTILNIIGCDMEWDDNGKLKSIEWNDEKAE